MEGERGREKEAEKGQESKAFGSSWDSISLPCFLQAASQAGKWPCVWKKPIASYTHMFHLIPNRGSLCSRRWGRRPMQLPCMAGRTALGLLSHYLSQSRAGKQSVSGFLLFPVSSHCFLLSFSSPKPALSAWANVQFF